MEQVFTGWQTKLFVVIGGRALGALGQPEDSIQDLGRGVAFVAAVALVSRAYEGRAFDLALWPEVRLEAVEVGNDRAGLVAAFEERNVSAVAVADETTPVA